MYDQYGKIACNKDCGRCEARNLLNEQGAEAVRETLESNRGKLMFREIDVTAEEAQRWASLALPRVIDRQPTKAEIEAVRDSILTTVNPTEQCETVFDFLYE